MRSEGRFRASRLRWMALVSLLCICALMFTAACGGGDDDDDDDDAASNDATVTVTTGPNGSASPTSTVASEASATSTSSAATAPAGEGTATEAVATATERAAVATSTERPALATATESDVEATATEEGTAAADDPLADVVPIDPEALPNFSMTFSFDTTGIPGQDDATITLDAEQSAIDNYHMQVQTAGTVIETWLVDGTNYVDQDGTIVPLPEGTDGGLFSPAIFLQEVPPIEPELQAERVGDEEVSGRDTVHYVISGENYIAQSGILTDGSASDIEGQVDVWIDKELNMMVKQTGDITWTNEDGTTGTFFSDMLMFDIGSTAPVEAPQ